MLVDGNGHHRAGSTPSAAAAADGDASMKNLLGGKGANLAEMSALGLPVPPGFTITTEACIHYYANGQTLSGRAGGAGRRRRWRKVEAMTGKAFGDAANPLLVSVRSGARASMPGMMDTVLNLGLNDETVEGLAKLSGDRRFAFDSYRRFIQMYSNVVLGLEHHMFEEILDDAQGPAGRHRRHRADGRRLGDGGRRLQGARCSASSASRFPQDPHDQLWGAVGAVFASWMNDRAKFYRRMHDIPESWGTAVNVQSMVFGNMGETSATGVAFTRNPSTGENAALRRVPDQRPGRGRGRRHPHAAGPDQGRPRGDGRAAPLDGRGAARGVRPVQGGGRAAGDATTATCRTSSSRSSRAGSTCCRPATASAPPRPR